MTAAEQHNRKKTTISSHILDTNLGVPAQGIRIKLQKKDDSGIQIS
jgi:5-hydroxyisourate hydrolase-like protein (transthyretin family)